VQGTSFSADAQQLCRSWQGVRNLQTVQHAESMVGCVWSVSDATKWACLSFEGQVTEATIPKAVSTQMAW
jgi:hypothetical protein